MSGALSVGQYIGMFLLLCIPLLNIVLLFVWSFGSSVDLNKRNFARAALIMVAIGVIVGAIAGGLIAEALSDLMSGF